MHESWAAWRASSGPIGGRLRTEADEEPKSSAASSRTVVNHAEAVPHVHDGVIAQLLQLRGEKGEGRESDLTTEETKK